MKVNEIMTRNPAFCVPDSGVEDVARMMCDNDCGEIPVLEDADSRKPVGAITDRDITCRLVAEGRSPGNAKAKDCMSTPCVTVGEETSLEDCCRVLEEHRIRRVPVVDDDGRCVGIVSQADLALKIDPLLAAELLHEVSAAPAT
jgi:CBS domain-containing protein